MVFARIRKLEKKCDALEKICETMGKDLVSACKKIDELSSAVSADNKENKEPLTPQEQIAQYNDSMR